MSNSKICHFTMTNVKSVTLLRIYMYPHQSSLFSDQINYTFRTMWNFYVVLKLSFAKIAENFPRSWHKSEKEITLNRKIRENNILKVEILNAKCPFSALTIHSANGLSKKLRRSSLITVPLTYAIHFQ